MRTMMRLTHNISLQFSKSSIRRADAMFGMRTMASQPRKRGKFLMTVKEGIIHYWNGTKLLVLETKISWGLLKKLVKGEKLIRREYSQLVKTSSDLFRLVPFIVIALVPFLEFALPLILKVFPNMLPSTYESHLQKEERIRKQLNAKIKVARLLQDAAEAISREDKEISRINDLFRQARSSGNVVSSEEIIEASKNLTGSVNIDGLPRQFLLNLCKYLGLSAFGTENYLRFQIQRALERIKTDDLMISDEGIDSLSSDELRHACNARGIRIFGVSDNQMRQQLQQWLDLHLVHRIPALFLIWSRAMSTSPDFIVDSELASQTLLSSGQQELPGNILKGTEDIATKIAVLQAEQRNIQEELSSPENQKASDESHQSQIEKVSQAVAELVSPQESRDALEDLKKDGISVQNSSLAKSFERLVGDIEDDVQQLDLEIQERLQKINTNSSENGNLSEEDIKSLIKLVRNSPDNYVGVKEIVERFDRDKDGKIFIDDIIAYLNNRKKSSS